MGMKLNAELFEAHLKCPTKCWLKSLGESGSGNEYAEWVKKHSQVYRDEGVRQLLESVPEGERATESPGDGIKAGKWRLAVDLTVQGPWLKAADRVTAKGVVPVDIPVQPTRAKTQMPPPPDQRVLESALDAVERVPPEGRGRAVKFVPVRFICRNKLTKDDKLLLAFDVLVLGAALGREIEAGKIIHGDDHATLKVKTAPLAKAVRKHVEKIVALLGGSTAPDLVLNRHCGECQYRDQCRQQAIEKDDLSLLGGMSAKERQKLRSKGIFTVNQLSFTFRPRRPPKRAKHPSNPRHYALQSQAIRENTVYIHGKPEIPDSQVCLFFDVEGVPWRESYYLIGILVVEAGSARYQSFWANDESDQAAMLAEFCRFARTYPDAPLFHYGNYDVNALREMGLLLSEHERSTLREVLPATFNVLPVVHSHVYFPFHSMRLRQVASFLGIKFASGIRSGLESVIFREKWRESGDEPTKNRLLAYNREDCESLRKVCDFIRQSVALAEARVPVPGRQENFTLSESLRRAGEGNRPAFKKAEFVLPEFEKINRCAYFDYQREKIYARTKRKAVVPNRHPSHTIRRPSQDTEVVLKCRRCPHCGSKWISPRRPLRRRLLDLKFFKTGIGVKRWQPNYLIHRYHCRACGADLTASGLVNPRRESIYGHNVMCWVVYHNVVCKQSLLQVERSLSDVFGLRLPYKNVYRFRRTLADYYRPLRDEILTAILGEGVINIDETPVNLRKTTGYVWVLATHNKVYFVFKESREGAFLKDLLAGFSGVLVSDFFTAYDSLECQHQKCLVHLMRDINDDLRRHPFDEELRCIAQGFGAFLVSIVSTIDRWGLRSHHLHKHVNDADRLLRQIHRRSFASEQAANFQKRFEKYAHSLFTFLRHDHVPWNNNNAEHAVHYFAKVRRFTDGTFTSSSIEELLTLVTVLQTCEYNNVNPLKFLLSGEKSLAAITARKH